MNQPLFLVGMPGAGKSTIGRKLALALQKPFLDLDEYLEGKYQQKVSQLFSEKGEAFFREAEAAALREVGARATGTVIATGGGTPCFRNNMAFMNETGTTIFIKVPEAALVERLVGYNREQRPLIAGKTTPEIKQFVTTTLANRLEFYSQAQIIYQNASRNITDLIHLIQRMESMC